MASIIRACSKERQSLTPAGATAYHLTCPGMTREARKSANSESYSLIELLSVYHRQTVSCQILPKFPAFFHLKVTDINQVSQRLSSMSTAIKARQHKLSSSGELLTILIIVAKMRGVLLGRHLVVYQHLNHINTEWKDPIIFKWKGDECCVDKWSL